MECPCLAPLATGPFYAVPISAGTLGTSGGLDTDFNGRVLDRHLYPIPRLYAAGNVSASVFRNNYPGGGATLGSVITRAFAVGEHLSQTLTPLRPVTRWLSQDHEQINPANIAPVFSMKNPTD